MKLQHLFILFLVCSVISRCKNENVKPEEKATGVELLLGKWSLVKDSTASSFMDTVVHVKQYLGKTDDYYDFRADGKCYIKENGENDTTAYKMASDNSVIFGDSWSYKDSGSGETVTFQNPPSAVYPLTNHSARINFSSLVNPGGGMTSKTVYLKK